MECDCGNKTHRDLNAARNILAFGLNQLGLERPKVYASGDSKFESLKEETMKALAS